MKKYLYLLMMMVVCAGFVACGDDDDSTQNSALDGTWTKVTEYNEFCTFIFKGKGFVFQENLDHIVKYEGNFEANEDTHVLKFYNIKVYKLIDEKWTEATYEYDKEKTCQYLLSDNTLTINGWYTATGTYLRK